MNIRNAFKAFGLFVVLFVVVSVVSFLGSMHINSATLASDWVWFVGILFTLTLFIPSSWGLFYFYEKIGWI